MSEALRIEIALPLDEAERALQAILVDKAIPCESVPIETPPGICLSEGTLSNEQKQALEALRRAMRLLDELEAMGRVSPTGQKVGEEMAPLDRLTRIVQKVYGNEWEFVNEEELKDLRADCLKRLRVIEAMASALKGRYAAVFRLEVPTKNFAEIESLVQDAGTHWVMRNLGAADSRASGKGIFSRLLGGKK